MKIFLLCFILFFLFMISNKTYIKKSKINGDGLYSNIYFKKNEIILDNLFPNKDSDELLYDIINKDKFNKYISEEGTKINHCSKKFNSKVYTNDYKIYKLVATKDIKKNTEITCNYDITNKKYPFIDNSKSWYKKC